MPHCISFECGNDNNTTNCGVTFFHVPINKPDLRREWQAKVRLDVDTTGVAMTEFSHDFYSTSDTQVPSVCAAQYCWKSSVFTYDNTLAQMTTLIDSSVWCEQFIRYKCSTSHGEYSGWYNRAGSVKRYWGTARGVDDRGSGDNTKCPCYFSNNCASNSYCNCMANDAPWRVDEGPITYRPDLPVTQLGFGDLDDNGNNGAVQYQIHNLKCYGRQNVDNPSAFEVLETKTTTYSGYAFLAVKVRLPSDGKCKTGDCCRDYQRLCEYLGNYRPTGCSQPHISTNWPRRKCYSIYNSDQNINNALSCNPSGHVAAAVNAAFGITSASSGSNGNSFGFHVCDGYCSTTLAASATAVSYMGGALAATDKIAYTLCRPLG